jgi:hypothetical protein
VDEHDGIVGAHGAETGMGRESFDGRLRRRRPFVLVPSTTHDPVPRPGISHRILNQSHDLVPGVRSPKIQLHQRLAQAHVVAVGIDETGEDEVFRLELNDAGVGTDKGLDLGFGSYEDDVLATGGQGFDFGRGFVESEDAATTNNEVG